MITVPGEVPHPDHLALVGTWQMLKAHLSGEEMPEFAARKIELEFGETNYVVHFDGEPNDLGTYLIEPHSHPKACTLTGHKGPNAGRIIPCVYQLVGDRLRVAYGLDGKRPAEFSTAKDRLSYVATYQRKSP